MVEKITEQDYKDLGVLGMPDVPGLSAEEMQEKMEELVKLVAFVKINEIIDHLTENGVTKEYLNGFMLEAGAVTSVFGRAGDVQARAGDYTAEMVGAAPDIHAGRHKTGGADPLAASDIGAAAENHGHGNITGDGKIGTNANMFAVTGLNGLLETKSRSELKLPEDFTLWQNESETVSITLLEHRRYELTNVKDLAITADAVNCYGFIQFGETVGTVTLAGFGGIEGNDDLTEAVAGDVFEFSCASFGGKGYIYINKWGE